MIQYSIQKRQIGRSDGTLRSDFKNFEIIELSEQEVELQEGLFHNGKGSVIRFVGRKK